MTGGAVTRKRLALVIGASVAALALVMIGAALVLRSAWFSDEVRRRTVTAVEAATGGRAELGDFRFDWKRLRIEADEFVLHGTEPAGEPALFRAKSIAAGFRIVSLLGRDARIEYLEIRNPHVYLIVDRDGHTNLPEPRIKRTGADRPVETLLRLAIGRFHFEGGMFEVKSRTRMPFDASGRDLEAEFSYERGGPRYRGEFSIRPLQLQWSGQEPRPIEMQMNVALERNRIGIPAAIWTSGNSRIQFSGEVVDLASPHASFQYQASASLADLGGILHLRGFEGGTAQVAGTARWAGGTDYSVTGDLHAFDISYRQEPVRLRQFRADGVLGVDAGKADLSGMRLAGQASYAGNGFPVEGRLGAVSVHGGNVEFRGASLALLGGRFNGGGAIGDDRFRVSGDISGWEARRAVAVYNKRQALPWNSIISGAVAVEGGLRRKSDVRVTTSLTLEPAPSGPPVRGQIAATYDAHSGTLDLGASTVSLPSSRVEVSGAIGRQMRVRLETRDLRDFLPVLGERASALPVKLENGTLAFAGTVTGKPADPEIAGRVTLDHFVYSGESFDSFRADVRASSGNVEARNAEVRRGPLNAMFQASVGLRNWNTESASALAANGTIRNANLAELVALLRAPRVAATGTLNATGQIGGTMGNPQASGDVNILKGALGSEPFDRLAAHVNYANRTLEASSGQLIAGSKQIHFGGAFQHATDALGNGRLRFEVDTNAMALEQIRVLQKARPGVAGTVELTAHGTADLRGGGFHIVDLQAEVAGRGLELAGQMLGDAKLSANSQGPVLKTALDFGFANSTAHGQGEWKLEGDYPGSATVTFSRLDLARLRDWIAPAKSGEPTAFSGFAEGELQVSGPALKPRLMTAEVRIPKLEIGPGPGFERAPEGVSLALRNSGPIVARFANSAVTIENARLVGHATDLTVGGRLLLEQKSPLDLRGNGRVDLAVLHDFDKDLASSGLLVVDGTVRGSLDAPQINGRMEVQNAAVTYSDFPNGLSNASGVILFTGERATIQRLSGETGGGKIQFTGFAGYSRGETIFRLHANAQAVRVRYPEGVSTVGDANLNFTGTATHSMLSGTITVLRAGLNLESDFSSMLAKSAEPVQTPSASAGFLSGLSLDVAIQTAPDVQFETSLTQGVEANAGLRLRGTATNPALIGRINVTQGQIVFFGTKYVIDQGTVSFYNPVRIEPILDVDLQTKARGIDITLTVSGPLNKLNLTPRSDPPLQFNEIVALLATGRSPTSDPTLAVQQGAATQSYQQSTGSALLGQVIASPVSGRLQRFFGISKLRIDPTLPGIEYNPQARLTLEQQVTPDVTFTYITNVTSANPQVVSVEWAVSKKWSVVALREENGLFGLDFFFKRRFK